MRLLEAADKVADMLIGQCMISLEQAVETVADEAGLSVDDRQSGVFLNAIDQRVFCCDCCAWYCDTEELNNDTGRDLCEDCAEDDDSD